MTNKGFTLLELLIVITMVGILSSLAVVLVRPNGFEVRQAAQTSANAIVRARLEAIRVNGYSTVVFDSANRQLVICTDDTPITTCGADQDLVRSNLPLGDDFPRVLVTPSADFSVTFDRRGFSRGTMGTLTFSASGADVSRIVSISSVGRVSVGGG